jgi:hypothetical protein
MNVQRSPLLLLIAAVVIGVIAALVFGIGRAPVSDNRGNAPSSLTGAPCEGVPQAERQSCLDAYRSPAAAGATGGGSGAREVRGGSPAAQSERGSGVEGVPSSGTTSAPAAAR